MSALHSSNCPGSENEIVNWICTIWTTVRSFYKRPIQTRHTRRRCFASKVPDLGVEIIEIETSGAGQGSDSTSSSVIIHVPGLFNLDNPWQFCAGIQLQDSAIGTADCTAYTALANHSRIRKRAASERLLRIINTAMHRHQFIMLLAQ